MDQSFIIFIYLSGRQQARRVSTPSYLCNNQQTNQPNARNKHQLLDRLPMSTPTLPNLKPILILILILFLFLFRTGVLHRQNPINRDSPLLSLVPLLFLFFLLPLLVAVIIINHFHRESMTPLPVEFGSVQFPQRRSLIHAFPSFSGFPPRPRSRSRPNTNTRDRKGNRRNILLSSSITITALGISPSLIITNIQHTSRMLHQISQFFIMGVGVDIKEPGPGCRFGRRNRDRGGCGCGGGRRG